ncbi:MAG: insulinase family protein [Eubacteriales bacterium]
MNIGVAYHGFTLKRICEVPELDAKAYQFVHDKSGAQLLYVENDDLEKVFSITFKTVPEDDTGVFHILEHSVLCGSDKYPTKEPFVELLKGSMQTFLNAMTFPDKTMYPFASTNEKDFMNLMSVYMDAVLQPCIYDKEEIFMQEGWHCELPAQEAPYFNGVVYNEMKGAHSSPDTVLYHACCQAMFPDTAYRFESGGDPVSIPELTYRQFLDAHERFYHPENSYIFLYGQMDLQEKLSFLNLEYLSAYDRKHQTVTIDKQKPIGFVKREGQYEIGQEDEETDNARMAAAYMLCDYDDRETIMTAQIILNTIAGSNNAPLKKAVLDAGLGKDFSAHVIDGLLQPYLYFSLRKSNPANAEQFLQVLRDTVTKLCEQGIDRDELKATINNFEFSYRERDNNGTASGVLHAMTVMDGWLYGGDPIAYLSGLDILKGIREKLDTTYPEELLRRVVPDSRHSALVVLTPSRTLAEARMQAERDRVRRFKESHTEAVLAELSDKNRRLQAFQQTADSEAALRSLPMLTLNDINPDAQPDIPTAKVEIDGISTIRHDIFTNGIGYLNCYFDLRHIPFDRMSLVALLAKVLGKAATRRRSALALFTAIKGTLGDLIFVPAAYARLDREELSSYLTVKCSVLEQNIASATELIEEVCLETVFEASEVRQIVQQQLIAMEQVLVSSGTSIAAGRVSAKLTTEGKYKDAFGGYAYYQFIKAVAAADIQEICGRLKELSEQIFCKENMTFSVTGNDSIFQKYANKYVQMPENSTVLESVLPVFSSTAAKEGIRIPAAVSFDAMGADFRKKGYAFSGGMQVLAKIITLDYLWNRVRVQGGAYGTGMSVTEQGTMLFTSYRDPHIQRTLSVFDQAVAYLEDFHPDEREMTKYIIGTLSGLDRPMLPREKGEVGDSRFLRGITLEHRQKRRTEVLRTTAEQIRGYADVLRHVLQDRVCCVVGASDKLDAARELFDVIVN